MTTSEAIGCYRVFEMAEDGEMFALTVPRMTAAECFEFVAEQERLAVLSPTSQLGVYRRVEGGWEEVLR